MTKKKTKRPTSTPAVRAVPTPVKPASPTSANAPTVSAQPSASRTRARAASRKQQQRRRQQVITAGVVGVIALVLVVLAVLASRPANVDTPDTLLARYDGLNAGVTAEGHPILGNPNAPAQLVEYSSFDCPTCGSFHAEAFDALMEQVRAGALALTFVPVYGTGSISNGEGAARAALCVMQQSPAAFWPFHDLLFEWQRTLGNRAYAQEQLLGGANAVGVDANEVRACSTSIATTQALNANLQALNAQDPEGVGRTPTLLVNGQRAATPTLDGVLPLIEAAVANAPAPVVTEAVGEAAATAAVSVTEDATAAPTEDATVDS